MITINNYPVLLTHEVSSIAFTDCGETNQSIVYMDRAYAPRARDIVLLRVRNQEFDSTKAESDTNRKYLIQQWMFVEQVFAKSYPVNYKFDENNDPIINETTGKADLGTWDTRSTIVKVVLREHKHVLARQYSLDNVNMVSRLPFLLNAFNSLQETPYENQMLWTDLAKFLSNNDYRFLFYLDEYPDEVPPVIPRECYWKNLTLAQCLHDLALNFNGRLISEAVRLPEDEDFDDQELELTRMHWRTKKRITYYEDVVYKKIDWPVHEEAKLQNEKDSKILFPVRGVNGNYSYYDHGTVSLDASGFEKYDFICRLFPYQEDFDDALTLSSIYDYLRETHVNVESYYAFISGYIPPSFYEEAEWSSITILYGGDVEGVEFHVEHKPRDLLRAMPQFNEVASNVIFRGVVKSSSSDRLVLQDTTDLTNNIVYPGTKTIDYPSIDTKTPNGTSPLPGDMVTFGISGNSIVTLDINDRAPYPSEITNVKYNGNDVASITWTCPAFTFAIADLFLQSYDPVQYPHLNLFNYSYVEHEVMDANPFNTMTFEFTSPSTSYQNFTLPTSANIAKVTCRSLATEEQVKEYARKIIYKNRPVSEELVELSAKDWIRRYQYVSFYVYLTKELLTMSLKYHARNYPTSATGVGLHPDIIPENFYRASEVATTLPYTFTSELAPSAPFPNIGTVGVVGIYDQIVAQLGWGYQSFFAECATNVSLTNA